MKNSNCILWLFLLLLIGGCNLEDLDFEKLSKEITLSPEFVAPIAKANITVWDLVQSANKENDDVIQQNANGLIKIVYKQDSLFKYNVREFLNFPNSLIFSSGDKVLGNISPENASVSQNISLTDLIANMNGSLDGLVPLNGMNLPFPAISVTGLVSKFSFEQISDFTTLTLNKGTLEIKLENNLKIPLTIKGNFFDKGYNREIANFTFANIAPNATRNTTVSLSDVQLSNQVEFRMLSFDTPGSTAPVNINLADYFNVTFNLVDLGISKGNLLIKNSETLEGSTGVFDFDFPEPDLKAYSAVLKKGTLKIVTTNSSQLTGAVNFTLTEIKKNGNPVNASIPLSGVSTSIDLSGAIINYTADPTFPYNRIPYNYSLTVNPSSGYVDYSSSDIINMKITLDNLEFKSITGDFGKRVIPIDPGVFDMNVDLLDKIDGTFKLANPKLELIIRNSIGMPASVSIDFTASNKDGKIEKLNPPVFDIPVPPNINAGIAKGSIVFDKGNSNIVNFIALPPTSDISYMGQVNFNKSNQVITPLNPNFLDVDATFAIDMAMELPLELQIKDLAFKDTSAISGEDYEKIESAELILNAKNGIPLDINMQLLFVDTISKQQYGASKITKILSAAQVNSSGVITPVQSSLTFSLDATEMGNLRKANGIVFSGTVSSPSEGTVFAPIMSDSKLEMNVVIKAKVNL